MVAIKNFEEYGFYLIAIVLLFAIISCSNAPPTNIFNSNKHLQDISSILGKWKLEKQYDWNQENNQWEPGIILEDGTKTADVSNSYNEFKLGGPNCPIDKRNYITVYSENASPENMCYAFQGNVLRSMPVKDFPISVSHEWNIVNDKLEIISILEDPSKTFDISGHAKIKSISSRAD